MSAEDNAARRSAARERRRANGGADSGDSTSGSEHTETALNAAKSAAAVAAVAAALGALRALASRPDEAEQEQAPADEGASDGAAPDADDQKAAEAPEPTRDERARRAPRRREPEHGPEDEHHPGREDEHEHDDEGDDRESRREPRHGVPVERVRSIADRARDQLTDLQGRAPESISSLERTADGWRLTFEIVEVDRIPESTDVLATYVVELDGDGELLRYERLRRYYRAQADLGAEQ